MKTTTATTATAADLLYLRILATSWGVKNGGTVAKLTLKALHAPPCGQALFEKRAIKAQARCKRAFARLSKLAGSQTAYTLVYEAQRMSWLASFEK
jgi:hypothetical protein